MHTRTARTARACMHSSQGSLLAIVIAQLCIVLHDARDRCGPLEARALLQSLLLPVKLSEGEMGPSSPVLCHIMHMLELSSDQN